jgi:DNA-binding NtrC family response regulator
MKHPGWQSKGEHCFAGGNAKGLRVMANLLIVEKYRSIGLLYREVLQDEGHRVFVALNGKESLNLARRERVDAVIVDDRLPDFAAKKLLGRLKRCQRHMRSILSVSSDSAPASDARLWDGFFMKSSDFTILQREVKRVCQQPSRALPSQSHRKGHTNVPRSARTPAPGGK